MGLWQRAREERLSKDEVKVLKKAAPGLRILTMRIFGKKDLQVMLNRGWVILAHSGVGYGHSFNEYQLGIDREDLENRIGANT